MLRTIIALILSINCLVLQAKTVGTTDTHYSVGTHYMVTSAERHASEVGANILKKGGNAVDAAVAMGYALAVVHPCCGNIGGGGFMLIRFPDGKTTFINFREKAPGKSNVSLYLDKNGNIRHEFLSTGHITGSLEKPYMAVGVPGTVMGLNLALKKYGTLPLEKVLKPAIDLSDKGYELLPGDASILKTLEASLKREPNVSAIYLKNGQTYQAGDYIIQKDLANTLKEIAQNGTDAFYKGKIADEIVKASEKNGGLITKADLRNYRVEELKPLTCRYRGYQIITTPPPGSGATICEALKILEAYPINRYGFHTPIGSHYIAEAMRFAYADRNQYIGDPDFVQNPVKRLLSDAHIKELRSQIAENTATPSDRISLGCSSEGGNTTSYVVIDKKSMAVSVTYTLNDYFGAKVIPGSTGFFLNNELADFKIESCSKNRHGSYQGSPNLIAPNKRPLSSMSPTIVLKDNKVFMIIGTPGGSTIPSQLISVITNVIDYGLGIQEAIDAPRFHMPWLPDELYMEPNAFTATTQKTLEKMGYHLHLGSPYGPPLWGAVSGILIDPKNHSILGAMDYRRPSGATIGQ